MKLYFREEPRSRDRIALTIAVAECNPLMKPFRLNVTTKPVIKLSIDNPNLITENTVGHEGYTSYIIYNDVHTTEDVRHIIERVTEDLYPLLNSQRWFRGLSEAKAKVGAKPMQRKE